MKFPQLLCLLALGAPAAWAGPETNALRLDPAVMNRYAEELRTNAPSLLAAQARTVAARSGTDAVRTWADPEVSLGVMMAPSMMRRDDGDLVYGVSQKLPLFGQPAAARAVAAAETLSAETRIDYQFQLLRLQLVQRLIQTALFDQQVGLTREEGRWLEALLRVAEERFKAGNGDASEILRLQNELDLLRAKEAGEQALAKQSRQELDRLLARDASGAWPELRLPEPGPLVRFNDRLRHLTLRNEARLKVLRREAEVGEARANVARRAARPEVTVFGEMRQYSGSGEIREGMIGVGLTLPWFNRRGYRADVSRARAEAEAARHDLEDYERYVPVEAERVATLADNARREAVALRDRVVPRSAELVELLRQRWTSGEAELSQLLAARREWIANRRMLDAAIAEQWRMLAEITLCCGLADLEALDQLDDQEAGAGFQIPEAGSTNSPSRQTP